MDAVLEYMARLKEQADEVCRHAKQARADALAESDYRADVEADYRRSAFVLIQGGCDGC
jgi:hypothetical protein